MKLSEIEMKYKNEALVRGGVLLLPKSSALHFVEECRNSKIRIIGIDAFFITPESTQPSLENSIDYSSTFRKENTDRYLHAIAFLQSKPDSMFFEIVADE